MDMALCRSSSSPPLPAQRFLSAAASPTPLAPQQAQIIRGSSYGSMPSLAPQESSANSALQQSADRNALLQLIKSCGKERNLSKAMKLHSDVKDLIRTDLCVGTAMITMFSKCGALGQAKAMFEKMQDRNVVSWNAMISCYIQYGLHDRAMQCFVQMQDEGISPNVVTFVCILKACGSIKSIALGEEMHAEMEKAGFLSKKNVVLCTALLSMYAKCGALGKARAVFEEMPERNVVSWSALIEGYVQSGQAGEALSCFKKMRDEDILPDPVTYISVLKASGSIGSLEMGEEIHEEVKKRGFLGKHILLSTTLVDMYAKCGMMERAHKILLEDIPRRDVVSWNALITGYVQHGFGAEALQCFRKMQGEGVCPDSVTFICILEACGSMGILEIGEEIHGVIKENGLLDKDIVVGTALVDMYSKCGALEKAHQVLRGLPKRTVVSWNTLIVGYMQHGLGVEALKCFKAMHIDGISPDTLTFSFVFKTCGSIGFLNIGEEICATIKKEGLLGKDVALGTASVEMFSKCGMMQKALEVFKEIPHDDVASWNSLIRGYAQLGLTKNAFHLFEEMRIRGSMPNSVTFHTLMAACSHAGLVKEGEVIFEDMINLFSLYPSLDHYTCLVDLFGRAGLCAKVRAILGKVPNTDYPPLLSSLLGSCCKWMDVDLGKWAFQKLIHVEKKCAAAYICMRNLYDALGLHEEAVKIETQRLENEACKVLGCWWMDPLNENSYIVDDVTHVASRETYLCNN